MAVPATHAVTNAQWLDRLDALGRALICAAPLIPIAYLPFVNDAYALPKALLVQFLGLSFFFILAAQTAAGRRFRPLSFDLPLLVFAGALITATIFSTNRELSLFGSYRRYEGLITWASYMMIYAGAARFASGTGVTKRVLEILLWASGFTSIIAIGQYLLAAGMGDFRSHGTLNNPAFLGAFLVLTIPIALVFSLTETGRPRAIGALAAGVGLIALYLSFTRGAWLGVFFAAPCALGGVFQVPGDNRSGRAALAVGVVVLAVGLSIFTLQQRTGGGYALARLETAFILTDGSTASRLEMWKGAAALIKERPLLGWGLETFRENYAGSKKLASLENAYERADRPHNQLLYVAFAAGLIGAAGLYAFSGGLAASVLVRAVRGGAHNPLAWGMAGALVGYMIQAEFLFSSVDAAPVWWLLAGLSVRRPHQKETGDRTAETADGPAPLSTVILFTGAAAVIAFSFWGARLLYADYYFKIGLTGRDTGAPQAIGALEKASAANPRSRVYRLALGHAYLANGKVTDDRGPVEHAISIYQGGLEARADDEFLYSLGDALAFYGVRWDRAQLDPAFEAYRRAARMRPYFPYTYWEMGYIRAEQGAFKQAIALYRQSLALDPNQAGAWSDLGRAHEKLGRLSAARNSYERALRIDPGLQAAVDGLNGLRR